MAAPAFLPPSFMHPINIYWTVIITVHIVRCWRRCEQNKKRPLPHSWDRFCWGCPQAVTSAAPVFTKPIPTSLTLLAPQLLGRVASCFSGHSCSLSRALEAFLLNFAGLLNRSVVSSPEYNLEPLSRNSTERNLLLCLGLRLEKYPTNKCQLNLRLVHDLLAPFFFFALQRWERNNREMCQLLMAGTRGIFRKGKAFPSRVSSDSWNCKDCAKTKSKSKH